MPILAVAQFAPDKGNLAKNFDTIVELIEAARKDGAELLLLPEACTTGYFLEGGVNELALSQEQVASEIANRLSDHAQDIDVVMGYFEQSTARPYNSAILLSIEGRDVQVRSNYRKLFPPTYGVFDEQRFHAPGDALGLMHTRLGKVGVLICEDMWHSMIRTLLAISGAEILLVPAATPARNFASDLPENLKRYERMLVACAEEHGVWCALASLTGSEGGKLLSGGSMIVNPSGEVAARAATHGLALVMTEFDPNEVPRAQKATPLLQDVKTHWAKMKTLVDSVEFDES